MFAITSGRTPTGIISSDAHRARTRRTGSPPAQICVGLVPPVTSPGRSPGACNFGGVTFRAAEELDRMVRAFRDREDESTPPLGGLMFSSNDAFGNAGFSESREGSIPCSPILQCFAHQTMLIRKVPAQNVIVQDPAGVTRCEPGQRMTLPAWGEQGRLYSDGNGSVAPCYQQGNSLTVHLRKRRARKAIELEQARQRSEIRRLGGCRRFGRNFAGARIPQQLRADSCSRSSSASALPPSGKKTCGTIMRVR